VQRREAIIGPNAGERVATGGGHLAAQGNRTVISGRQKASESWLDVSDVTQGS
jgi:hypothetical protein